MEGLVSGISVWDKHCIGCEKFNKDILVSIQIEGDQEFHDFFLTDAEGKKLMADLQKRILENKK
jgi:hypothetical protein